MYQTGSQLVTVATCNLNQWALDFEGNLERILQSCEEAKQAGATYRLGPELEICGYGCEDHFLESDTFLHSWESLEELFDRGATDGILCDFGMPILFAGARYNCRVLCRDKKILMIRPKTSMADNGNYRESRYFTAYKAPKNMQEKLQLPNSWAKKFSQKAAPFGVGFLQCADGTTIGCESCEELWTPQSAHIDMALSGVEIIGNGSGSHHELRKLDARLGLMINATKKCGGLYLYANQRGCDGSRLYFDGCSMIVCNGKVLAQAKQFDLQDVQTIVATVDLDDIRSYRASIPSLGNQAAEARHMMHSQIVTADIEVGSNLNDGYPLPSEEIQLKLHTPEEECCFGPACWLWDFMRRSGAAGFFLPLSGGADSSSVAMIVGVMTIMVTEAAKKDQKGLVASECRRVCRKEEGWVPEDAREMASCVLHTTYMGTENSSKATESRAERLGSVIGSYHSSVKIDNAVSAMIKIFQLATGKVPQFSSQGGTISEDLALQNIQARLRMVTAYLFAQLLPWVRGRQGFLLVLGSANVDEGLRGYMTKYDCSAADLNPIGSISKGDLKRMLKWGAKEFNFSVLQEIVDAPPTAELRPMTNDDNGEVEHSQTDEEDMGMTYEELGYFGRLRKISRCGPVSMFMKLCAKWPSLSAKEVATKVKRFFFYYSVNRHKMCIITPSYHAEAYSPDDNRFDLRQFLYNTKWTRQFNKIDEIAENMDEMKAKTKTA
ncbi:glutamine-dependent NAD(+) synthetase [Chaetoceros tenuissimus]|uniref:Glutamine-dependent NAD(+) synthetase n=1 Tax=Chaetoceros tenuissimus TaxID=426638 RepID=A0AAD3CVI3_9STRA|nr:glutamine-dependent NAD(+) synthetase [Chaetoceros tenuissimus]